MRKSKKAGPDALRPEYDLETMKGGVRGKYAARLKKASNLVMLEPDVAAAFPTEAAANEALRVVLKAGETVRRSRANLDVTKSQAARSRSRRSKRSATAGAGPTSRVARPCG